MALINHSCDPNAVVVFPRAGAKDQEPLMQVIALKHISPNDEVRYDVLDSFSFSSPVFALDPDLLCRYHPPL